MREVFGGTSNEQSGVVYSGLFKDANRRIRRQNVSAGFWWLRSATSSGGNAFWSVNNIGMSASGAGANTAYGVAFGFCT